MNVNEGSLPMVITAVEIDKEHFDRVVSIIKAHGNIDRRIWPFFDSPNPTVSFQGIKLIVRESRAPLQVAA